MDLEEHVVGGRYVVKRRLQSGYFGVTWLARDRHIGIDICLKTFFSENPSQRKELVILKKLCEGHFEHDYLCKVFDVSIDRVPVVSPSGHIAGNIQYVVFEYCCGSDLFNFLCTGPWEKVGKVSNFSEPIARHYFKQVVLGVMYLHERGVYHRDIKPENCVLDDNLNLKLTDFGTNKFLSADPMQLLRTKTRGVGTESYRAPEVNSGRGYDPAAADVWSLGVMLFFFVGVEQMFNKVQFLDAYSKQILAPLGIFFPFPLHCSKLDSYLRRDHELKARGVNGSLRGKSLNNELFWQEWATIRDFISSDLFDMFNRIFLLEPSLRITIRDILRHSWMNVTDGMSPEIVKSDMERRCPSDIRMSRDASPRVMGSKVLGGVDQVVLRESLSGASRDDIQFPEDSETWPWLSQLQHLESIQLLLLGSDIQELIMDLQLARKLLDDVLTHPTSEDHRTVFISHINADWIAQLLLVLGFLPQGHTLFLLDEYLNLSFLGAAITFLQGVELAVTRSIIETTCGEEDEDTEEDDVMEMEGIPLEEQVDGSAISVFRPPVFEGGSQGESTASESTSMPQYFRSISGELPNSMDTPMGSQGSGVWTMSTQSSQDEVPESLQLIHDWSADFSHDHKLIELATPLQVLTPKQYKAASEFCKMSGLLCSYGLYQVVCHDQLAVYCRGNTTSFSARIVHANNEQNVIKAYISTWCFSGTEEWSLILDKLSKDMAQYLQQ